VPFIGYVLDFIRTPVGLSLLVYLPALFVILKELQLLAAYYKSQEPYKIHTRAGQAMPSKSGLAPKMTAAIAAVVTAGVIVVAPAYAALSTAATLQGNTIRTANLAVADHILIRRLDMRCGRTHTNTASQRPVITLYNPTNKNIATGSWHIDDNSGRLVTLSPGTVLKARHQYVITPLLRTTGQYGIQFAGDRIALIHANSVPVDGVSWGSDSSQLSTPLPALSLGTSIRRTPPRRDTNTVGDWQIVTRACQPDEQESSQQPAAVDTFTVQELGDVTPATDVN
jgi:hypothetical protein